MQIKVVQDKNIMYLAKLTVLNNDLIQILKCDAYIGEKGMTNKKVEGDKKTPIGIFSLGLAFGTDENVWVNQSIKYIKLNNNLYWVDDVKSKNYNKLVDISKQQKDFKSGEHLIDYEKEYKYGIEIKANQQNIKSKGSAIFLHCSNQKPTAGCIAIEEKYMKKILRLIDSNTKIFISPK